MTSYFYRPVLVRNLPEPGSVSSESTPTISSSSCSGEELTASEEEDEGDEVPGLDAERARRVRAWFERHSGLREGDPDVSLELCCVVVP